MPFNFRFSDPEFRKQLIEGTKDTLWTIGGLAVTVGTIVAGVTLGARLGTAVGNIGRSKEDRDALYHDNNGPYHQGYEDGRADTMADVVAARQRVDARAHA